MLRALYRRTGADPPFGDPGAPHGTAFEGWYWRLTLPAADDVLAVVHGVSRDLDGQLWGTHALATRTQLRATYEPVSGYPADPTRIVHAAGPDAWIDAHIDAPLPAPHAPLGGLGLGQVVPFLSQYWHPLLLGGRARGRARVGPQELDLDGALVYAEKNWGRGGFPAKWWWGQAFLDDGDACVCFAGGRALGLGPAALDASAMVVRIGDRHLGAAFPLQRVRADVGAHGWRLRGGGIELEGDADGTQPTPLPVPLPRERRNLDGAARQHLAGRLALTVRRRGRVVFRGETALAGLEQGST